MVVNLRANVIGTTGILGDDVGVESGLILGESDRQAAGGPLAHDPSKRRPPDKEEQHYANQHANAALSYEGRENSNMVKVAGQAVDLSLYPRLKSLIRGTDDLVPHLKTLSWVIRVMDELYNARRRADQASFAAEEDFCNLDAGTRRHASFPAFVYKHLKNRHGIKYMVRSACLDLLCNAHMYRKHHSDVEVFARFLEEFYCQKELCFFLDVRAEAHRVARVCTQRRSMIQPVWMSHADCVRVAKGVFLDTSTLYFRDLVATVHRRMLEHRQEDGQPKSDRKRISLSDFLYVAMVCFVSPKKPQEEHAQDSFSVRENHPPSKGGSLSMWSEGAELAPSKDVSPMPVPLKSSGFEYRHFSGVALSNSGSNLDTTRRSGRDDDREGSSTWPYFFGQHICDANRGSSGNARRETTCGASITAPIEVSTDSFRRVKSSNDGRRFLDDGGAHTYLTRESYRTPMVMLGSANARSSTSPVRTTKEIPSNAECAIHRTACSPPESSRDSHEASMFAKLYEDSDQADRPLCSVEPPSPKSPPTHHEQWPFHGRREEETPFIDHTHLNITTKAQEDTRSPITARKGGLVDGARVNVWGEARAKEKKTLGEIRKSRVGTGMSRLRAPVTSPLVAPQVSADTLNFADRVATARTEIRTHCRGENIAKGGKSSIDGGESACWSRVPTIGGNHTSYISDRWSGDGNRTACVSAKDASGTNGSWTSFEISDFVPVYAREEDHGSEVAEVDAFFSLPCSPRDRPRPNRDPPEATHEAACVAGATQMPVGGIATPPTMDDFFSLNKRPGTRKRGDFHGLVKHTRGGYVAATGKRSDDSVLDEQSKGASPPLRGGYIRRACFGNDKQSPWETLVDGHLGDESEDESEGLEIRTDVLEVATGIFTVFERKFLPCLAGTASSEPPAPTVAERENRGRQGKANDFLPPAIRRIISEEMVRVLALHRPDLHAVARQSPDLLDNAVEEAFRMLESTVSTAAAHSRALCNMGRLLEDRENPDDALLCFEEASAVDAASAEALCWKAGNLQRRGDLVGAAVHFEGALARDESFSSAWYGLGQVKATQGKNADAVKAFTRWLDESNKHWIGSRLGGGAFQAKGLVQLGDAHRFLGQDEFARRSYERAIEMDNGCSEAHFKLGSLLLQAQGGREAEALEAFRRAVDAAAGAATAAPDSSEKRRASAEHNRRE